MKKIALSAVLGLLAVLTGSAQNSRSAADTASPVVFWISPAGSDAATGTEAQPWKTPGKARDFIRANGLNVGMTADITVNLKAGEYYLTSALSFGTADSGSNGFSIIYRSVDGPGAALLHAGSQPTGWQLNAPGSNIWKVNVGASKAIRSVFENGQTADLARSPNRAVKPRYAVYRGNYRSSAASGNDGTNNFIQYNAGEFDPSTWTVTAAASMAWWSDSAYHNWGLENRPITAIDPASRKFTFTNSGTVPSGAERYYVQGIYELLDAPGEFFYDTATGWLYYYPRDGAPANQDIRVPLLNQIISVTGTAPANHAHHLTFDGLSIAYARGTGGGTAAVTLQSTDHIEVRNCHMYCEGDSALSMTDANAYNTVYGCLIEHTGTGGIWLNNTLNRTSYPDDRSEFNVISNCKIHDIGENYVSAIRTAGVLLFCTNDCQVSHCDIYNSARYGISLRGHWSTQYAVPDSGLHFSRNNTFSYIRLTDCLTDSGDAGMLHAAHCNGSGDPNGANNINFWNQILISGGYEDPGMDDWKAFGIYCDHPQSCLYQNFSNIKVTWMEGSQFHQNDNPTQTTSNVNWTGSFNDTVIQYNQIGLLDDFPAAYDDRGTVIADDHTDGYTESDAIYPVNDSVSNRLTPQNGPNSSWSDTTIGNLHKGDGRYHAYNAAGANQYAEWHPTLPRSGSYAVWVWKMDADANASSAAPYTVYYSGGTQSATVNQQTGAAGWVLLGTQYFLGGRQAGSGYVRLFTNSADAKAVRADAVKFEYVAAPAIATDPVTQSATLGADVTLTVAATGGGTLSYQWSKDSLPIGGATTPSLLLSAVQSTDAGTYTVTVTNAAGLVTSAAAVLTVNPADYHGVYFGTFSGGGGHWALEVHADDTATYLAYLPARHSAIVVHLTVSTTGGFTATDSEIIALSAEGNQAAQSISIAGSNHPSATGGSFTLTGQITGAAVSGQLDGLGITFSGAADSGGSGTAGLYTAAAIGTSGGTTYAIIGASGQVVAVTTATTMVDGAAGAVDAGGALIAATDGGGQLSLTINASAQSIAASLTPAGSTTPVTFGGLSEAVASTSRLVNISTRAYGSTRNNVTIGGFVISGSTTKRVLLRAVGPTLSPGLSSSEVMLDPTLELHDAVQGNAVIATNDNVADNTNAADIVAAAARIGATPLATSDTKSSALLLDLPPGVYSFVAHGQASTSGIVLAEIYDADTANLSSRLVNISSRTYCATGNRVAIGGYVVSGNAPKRLLVRAVGPTLATLGLGATEVMLDPTIEVHDAINGNAVIATNDNWGDNANAAAIASTSSRIGATPFASSDTKSSALLVTLPPGVYSFVVHGKDDGAGIVLLEVYDAD